VVKVPPAREARERRWRGYRGRMEVPDRRPLVLVALFALLAAPFAGAALLAELTVVAYGAQRFDLATGFTELVDGGEVIDQASGVRLTAPWLRYAEGDQLEARDADVELPLGRLSAPRVEVDLHEARLVASGGVTLIEPTGQVITAATVIFDAREGWAIARGDVTGSDPSFTAAALYVDVESGRLVLEGPYRYQDGLMGLRSEDPAARLQLTPQVDDDGTVAGYDARTRLDDDLQARLEAVLQ
jgi:hypothetical protein